MLDVVRTTLSSKVVHINSHLISNLAYTSVMKIYQGGSNPNIDLKNIKIVKKLGSTIEESQILNGMYFVDNKPSQKYKGPKKIKNPKIALIQFCLSSPKTDMENNIVLSNNEDIDKILKEERRYIIEIVKKIMASGANLILVQKNILRDAINELS